MYLLHRLFWEWLRINGKSITVFPIELVCSPCQLFSSKSWKDQVKSLFSMSEMIAIMTVLFTFYKFSITLRQTMLITTTNSSSVNSIVVACHVLQFTFYFLSVLSSTMSQESKSCSQGLGRNKLCSLCIFKINFASEQSKVVLIS